MNPDSALVYTQVSKVRGFATRDRRPDTPDAFAQALQVFQRRTRTGRIGLCHGPQRGCLCLGEHPLPECPQQEVIVAGEVVVADPSTAGADRVDQIELRMPSNQPESGDAACLHPLKIGIGPR